MLAKLQDLPHDAELLIFKAGCEDYCQREVDEVEWQGGQVYLHLRGFESWRGTRTPNLLFTRQARTVHGVLACALLAAQVGGVVQQVRSSRAE